MRNQVGSRVISSVRAPGLMAIPLPHPGQSYYRALSDHQAILRQTLEKLEKEQQEADQATEIKGPVTAGVGMTQAQSPSEIGEAAGGNGGSDDHHTQASSPQSITREEKAFKEENHGSAWSSGEGKRTGTPIIPDH